jgi:SPP1 gp7 family putative phage head morphogenesis protein
METADRQLALAEDYAANLAQLEGRAETNTIRALRGSLEGLLGDLRRSYSLYTDSMGDTVRRDPSGEMLRPAGSYSAAEAAGKFRGVLEASKGFLKPAERRAWEGRYQQDLQDAVALGGDQAIGLIETVARQSTRGKGPTPFTAPRRGIVDAAVRTASAYIEGESARFRDAMTSIVADAGARGQSSRQMVQRVRALLEGVALDPQDLNQRMGGTLARAQLIARSELQNAYSQAALSQYRKEGYSYVRWIATESERTCKYCAARHGNVYQLEQVVVPAHPRCRCVTVPVSAELVEEKNAALRDQLLEGPRWRESQDAVLAEFAAGAGKPLDVAARLLRQALVLPTASERRRFPGIEEGATPAVATDAPGGGQTLEEAILEREQEAKARRDREAKAEAEALRKAAEDQARRDALLAQLPPELRAMTERDWGRMSERERKRLEAWAKRQAARSR